MLIPPFAPPEQFQDAALHPSADVYSMGATLFALLVGRPPFHNANDISSVAEMHRIMAGDVPIDDLPNTIELDLRDLILASMSKRAWDRPSAKEMAEQLDGLADPRKRLSNRKAPPTPNLSRKQPTKDPWARQPPTASPVTARPFVSPNQSTAQTPVPTASTQPIPPAAKSGTGSGRGRNVRLFLTGLALSPLIVLGFIFLSRDSDADPNLCLLYTSTSPRDQRGSRMPSSA